MKVIELQTGSRTEFVDITSQVAAAVKAAEVETDVVTVFVPHTTAGITINENADPDVLDDIEKALERMVPWEAGYAHCEGNAAAHVKAGMMGSSISVIVEDGRLQLGTWQGIYFAEFDGPRSRKVWIQCARR